MLDDIRDHDPLPTEEEQRWVALDTIDAFARIVLLATVALVVAWSTTTILEEGAVAPWRTVAHG